MDLALDEWSPFCTFVYQLRRWQLETKEWREAKATGWGVLSTEALTEWSEYTRKHKTVGIQVREKPPSM